MSRGSTTIAPRVSLVVETETDNAHHGIRLTDVVEAWKRQTAGAWIGDWIIVASRPPSPGEQRSAGARPGPVAEPRASNGRGAFDTIEAWDRSGS